MLFRSEENDRATSLLEAVRNFVGENNYNNSKPLVCNGFHERNNNDDEDVEDEDEVEDDESLLKNTDDTNASENGNNETDVSQYQENSLDSNDNLD